MPVLCCFYVQFLCNEGNNLNERLNTYLCHRKVVKTTNLGSKLTWQCEC